jgi:hypothetical protein
VVVLFALMTNGQHLHFPPWKDFVKGHIACGSKAYDCLSARCTPAIPHYPIRPTILGQPLLDTGAKLVQYMLSMVQFLQGL